MSERARILVVSSDSLSLRSITHLLSSAGYQVVAASTGMECLDLIRQSVPDLILSDVVLADLDGIELCGRIKGDLRASGVLFLLLFESELASHGPAWGKETRADGHIVRPISDRELLGWVKTMLRLKRVP